ncbi:MAG: hypothetical protein U9R77_00270 [Pseudomonadota bacterium]|nr:hypothetical protein [Pseudomonadota bacterium]
MTEIKPRLTTKAACRIVGLDRDRFNEHVAAGNFQCAPATVPGRARLFDPDDMIALYLFKEFLDEGTDAKTAGAMACEIALCAKLNPDEPTISLVYTYFTRFTAYPTSAVPTPDQWDTVLLSGTDIRKVLTYRIGKLRQMIAHYTEVERNTIGEDD